MNFTDIRRKCRQSLVIAGFGAIALVAFAAGVRFLAGPVLQKTPVVTFYPAIAIATYMGGRRGGLVAAAGSVLAAWYLFVDPVFGFGIGDRQDLYSVIAFGFASLLTVEIIAWINRIQDRLEAAVEQNRVLFLELKHRIANNLQAVAALLSLHRAEVPDGPARRIMEDAIGRIRMIGDVHRNIYQPGGEAVDAREFLPRLCNDIAGTLATKAIECRIDAAARWEPETVVPIALMLQELLSNAVEHGISGRDDGRIVVSLEAGADGARLLGVEDNGAGMPEGFDPELSDRLGLKLVRLFAQQIGAEIAWSSHRGTGTRATLVIPAGRA